MNVEDFVNVFSRIKETQFEIKNIKIDSGNIFITKSSLNT